MVSHSPQRKGVTQKAPAIRNGKYQIFISIRTTQPWLSSVSGQFLLGKPYLTTEHWESRGGIFREALKGFTVVPSYPRFHLQQFQLYAVNYHLNILRYFEREINHIHITFYSMLL